MAFEPLSAIAFVGSIIKVATAIREKGYKKENSIPQRYLEFRDALHRLQSNLVTIDQTTRNANSQLDRNRVGSYGGTSYDLKPLSEIIGNFQLTLEECKELLNDRSKFTHRNGVIANIIYNIDVDPHVASLIDRLAFHNVKISLVLDPFKLHVQSELGSLNNEQHQNTAERLQELKDMILTLHGPGALATPARPPPRDLSVPQDIATMFAGTARQRRDSTLGEASDFPLQEGLDAFFRHFNSVPQVLDTYSYLRLMKSIWIMDRIRQSQQWAEIQQSSPGGLYDRCIREMDRRLREECTRASKSPLPSLEIVTQLPHENFNIWPNLVLENAHSPTTDSLNFGILLDIPILPDAQDHTLRIVENIDGTLGVEDSTTTSVEAASGVNSEKVIQKLNLDPKSAYFIPIYAIPVSPDANPPALTVKLQSSQDGVNGIAPEFRTLDDLWRLQHLITGYRCVKQRSGVDTRSLLKGQGLPDPKIKSRFKLKRSSSTTLEERGNIQLWQRRPFTPDSATSTQPSPIPESDLLPSSPIERDRRLSTPVPIPIARRPSRFSTATAKEMNVTGLGLMGLTPPKSITTSPGTLLPSGTSILSSAHTKHISLGSSSSGIDIEEPTPPLLVLFLKSSSPEAPDLLSFLVIELDELTHINPTSCCRSHKNGCTASMLERSGQPLLARRYYAHTGLNSWNLAALAPSENRVTPAPSPSRSPHPSNNPGQEDSGAVVVEKMFWFRVAFSTSTERDRFNSNIGDLVKIFSSRMEDYRGDLKRIRSRVIVTRH
ncbi:hypothetical protein P154DRAFT_617287 [Amniculicola lignicola CBS 123094]|uniref:Fungal N-terminal domain-containing protein n=1 Tax=Amniculicola lignicola CBS 123094 TaxID=1392246 RepID=A0A6A5WSK0_9PLEO|nr:hypothetical protein P154DRAFT_617287 [Amniculicola lignicola CBS 123094]